MKKLLKPFAAFVFCLSIFLLTACDGDAPTITVQSATAIREKVTIDFTIWDIDDVLDELTLTITGTVDDEDYETTQRVTITGGSYATEEDAEADDNIEEEDFLGEVETVIFDGLDVGETYSVTFTATYNDKARKITPTIDEGKNINLSKLVTSGEGGEKEYAHQISSKEDFDIIRNDPDGYFELTGDIDCENIEITPFYSSSKKFVGDFDGKGFTISNFKQVNYDQYIGLFGYVAEGGEVYDLTIDSATINSLRHTWLYMGVVAGYNAGSIYNVDVTNSILSSAGSSTGNQYVGGFVGYNKGTGTITDCTIDGLVMDLNLPASARIGGFVGTSERENVSNTEISNCTVTDTLLDIQIENNPLYTSDSDIDIEISIGGFIGDNKAVISGCSSDTEILVYVEGTQTDSANNDNVIETETERNSYIDSMELRLGGFVGNNDGGYITDSSSKISSITIENAFLDKIYLGAFAGYNNYFSMINVCSVGSSTTFNVIVGEDTYLATSSTDAKTFGKLIGVDSAYSSSDINLPDMYSTTFVVDVRTYLSTDVDGVKSYDFVSTSVYTNNN